MNGMHGIIFSYEKKNGKNGLRELIEHRVHGSIPFGGNYRVVDFMLSNMVNAGISDVGVIMHGKCQSMLDHIGTGKSWDLSRNFGGLKLLPAFAYWEKKECDQQFHGRMEALCGVEDYLEEDIRQDYVVLADSDLVINIPLDDVLKNHMESGADITAVCTSALGSDDETYFELDETGRVVDTTTHTAKPKGHRCLDIFVLSKKLLLELVSYCKEHNLYSFSRNVLQEMGSKLHIQAYVWDGYAARISTIVGYYNRSMELLAPDIRAELFNAQRPIFAKENDSCSTYVDPTGECVNSLIADGCDIQGTVRNSIIFRGVTVEKDAVVDGCILFKDTIVERGSKMHCVIADKNVTIQEGRTLMGHENYPLVLARGTKV